MRLLAWTTILLLYALFAPLPHPCVSLEMIFTIDALLSGEFYGDDLNLLLAAILPWPTEDNIRDLHRLVQFPDYNFFHHLHTQASLPAEYLQAALRLPRAMLPLRPLLKSHRGRTWFLEHLDKLPGPIGTDDLSLRSFASVHQAVILRYIYHHQTQHRASSHWCLSLKVPANDGDSDGETEEETLPLLDEPNLWLLYDGPCHWIRQRHGQPTLTSVIHLLEALAGEAEAEEEQEQTQEKNMRGEYDESKVMISDRRGKIQRPNNKTDDGRGRCKRGQNSKSQSPTGVITPTGTRISWWRQQQRKGGEVGRIKHHSKDRIFDPDAKGLLLLARLRRALITGMDLKSLFTSRGYPRMRRIPRTPLQVALRFLMGGEERLPESMPKMALIWETLVGALERVIQARLSLAAIKFELMAHLLAHFSSFRAALVNILEYDLLEKYEPLEVSPYAIRQVLTSLTKLPRLSPAWKAHIAQNLLSILRLPLAGQVFSDQRTRASWWRRNVLGMHWRENKFSRHAPALIYINDPPLRGDGEETATNASLVIFDKQGPRFTCINSEKIINGIASLWWDLLVSFARGQAEKLPRLSRALRILMRRPSLNKADLASLILDGEESHASHDTHTHTHSHTHTHTHSQSQSQSRSPSTPSSLSVANLCIQGTTSVVALRKIIMALYIIYHGLRLAQYGLV